MKKLVLFLSFLGSLSAQSQTYQPMPDSNASWTYYGHMVMNDTYTKIEVETVGTAEYNGYDYVECDNGRYFREENKKVYEYLSPDGVDMLIFDFNLGAGDTLKLNYNGIPLDMVVQAEDSILIGSTYHRVLDFGEVRHIEGIGSDKGPFYWDIFFGADYNYFQTCFTNSTGLYVHNADESISQATICTNYLGIDESLAKHSSQFYVEDNNLILEDVEGISTLRIYNTVGQLVKTSSINSNQPFSLSQLPKGMYFGQLQLEEKNQTESLKFIVE